MPKLLLRQITNKDKDKDQSPAPRPRTRARANHKENKIGIRPTSIQRSKPDKDPSQDQSNLSEAKLRQS